MILSIKNNYHEKYLIDEKILKIKNNIKINNDLIHNEFKVFEEKL